MNLDDEVKQLKGIGPKKSEALKKLDIYTFDDLIHHYPREYEDRTNIRKISELTDGETALIAGRIVKLAKGRSSRAKKGLLRLLISDETGVLEVLFFASGYLERIFLRGSVFSFFGKVSAKNSVLRLLHPDFEPYDPEKQQRILPVYPLAFGVSQNDLRKWQKIASSMYPMLQEYLPQKTLARNRLCGIEYAMMGIHFPEELQMVKEAKFRLVFEELLLLQTGLFYLKNYIGEEKSGLVFDKNVSMDEFCGILPYEMTAAQKRVLAEISSDMDSPKMMNRLVQGDVGSGKTAVAAAAIYKAVKSGFQAVMMAPTELLARQHYDGLKEQFAAFGFKTEFLSGSLKAKQKRDVLERLELGLVDVLIGTHAVIQKTVTFHRLGLVITDEQHRFGVNQRALLTEKGENPDVLVMTATPIPRTLAVILYGDLDISIIDELPAGRKTIETRVVSGAGRDRAYEFLRTELQKGRQGYVVAPLIEDSEEVEARSAAGLHEELSQRFPEHCVALLHGGMKQEYKDEIMLRFYNREIDLLVATVVIEVGINVPNSTVMVIENAERFGLAQLHQLRGRVGRGSEQSYCILISEGKTPVSKERADIMTKTGDGFLIAEKDLELRGPGEFFGMRQHGIPELKIADLVKHRKLLEPVKTEALCILNDDPALKKIENAHFRKRIKKLFEAAGTIQL